MPNLFPWRIEEPGRDPYPSRGERTASKPDRFMADLFSPAAARMAQRGAHRRLRRLVSQVEALGADIASLGDDSLRAEAEALRPAFLARGLAPELIARGVALVREASWRHLGIRHYPVQLMGGCAMIEGRLIEMATGEGKTVTAALAAAVAALAGTPVHVVTVNDYLASRDAAQLRPVYAALGLSVACVLAEDDPPVRREAYAADITYVTGKELAFDYLRDGLTVAGAAGAGPVVRLLEDASPVRLRLRGLGFALVDEADSVLIDEARTPMIIAERDPAADALPYAEVLDAASALTPGRDFVLHPERRGVELTDAGRTRVAALKSASSGLLRYKRAREELVEQAVAALHHFNRDRDYILRDGKVEIVDEYTGRVAEGRQWERGLHQLIETKEQVDASPRDLTAARITTQSFFRRFARLAGMSGTVREHAPEFWSVYRLPILRIPTHRPVLRRALGTALHAGSESRWAAVAQRAEELARAGRPVLIGTRSVRASEAASEHLAARGVAHTVLNARRDREEAEVVARAGQRARVTVATNMAGRGTDIKLAPEVAANGGLHVIVTEYNDSARIDRQLIGRGARQGDPGSWEALVSLDDELFVLHLPRVIRGVAGARVLGLAAIRGIAQRRAGRLHARARRAVLAEERAQQRRLAFAGRC